MKKTMLITSLMAVAGFASANMLVSWDGTDAIISKTNTVTDAQGTADVQGTLWSGGQDSILRGSGDGFYGTDGVLGGADTVADSSGYKLWYNDNTYVSAQIRNRTGSAITLDKLVFDYASVWAGGPKGIDVYYGYGDLDDANSTFLTSFSDVANLGNGIKDYDDFEIDLSLYLTDVVLGAGGNATFQIRVSEAYSATGTSAGIVDNIGLTGTVIPEPATLGLVSVIAAGLFGIRRIMM